MEKEELISKIKKLRLQLFVLSEMISSSFQNSSEVEYSRVSCIESKMFLGKALQEITSEQIYGDSRDFNNDNVRNVQSAGSEDFKEAFGADPEFFKKLNHIKKAKYVRFLFSKCESEIKRIFNEVGFKQSIEDTNEAQYGWFVIYLMQSAISCGKSSMWMHQEMVKFKALINS